MTQKYLTLSVVLACLLFSLACGSAPTAPSVAAPLILSGQSNVEPLVPFLTQHAVRWWAHGGWPIEHWDVTGDAWAGLLPDLQPPAAAFLWWGGEANIGDGVNGAGLSPEQIAAIQVHYRAELDDLMIRVRAKLGPVKVLILEAGPNPLYDPIIAVHQQWVASDRNAVFIPTRDVPYQPDRGHATPEGLAMVAQRVLAAIP